MRSKLILGTAIVALALTAWLSNAHAQDEEEDCKAVCRSEAQQCIVACGENDDPIECEGDCQDTALDCHRQCN